MKKSNYNKPRATRVDVQQELHLLASSGGQSNNNRGVTRTGVEGDANTALSRNDYRDFN